MPKGESGIRWGLRAGAPFDRRYLSASERLRTGRSSRTERLADFETLFAQRLAYGARAHQPVCLVSQVARSGGTLLTRLFDGHPALGVSPVELRFSDQVRGWPKLDLAAAPREWFRQLRAEELSTFFEDGYTKTPQEADASPRLPFALVPSLQRELFLALVETPGASTQREVLDAYFTSFFSAWLDYRGGGHGAKRWTVGFAPCHKSHMKHFGRFFRDYPDGRLILLIREPASWFASARERARMMPRKHAYAGLESALALWSASALATREARETYGEKVAIVPFEDLVTNTERIMRQLARWICIEFDPCLTNPTFNGTLIPANSSFADSNAPGVRDAAVERAALLSRADRQAIEMAHRALYDELVAVSREDCFH